MIFPFSDNVPSRRKPFVTYVLILANLLALGWMLGQSGQDRAVMTHHRGFIPARVGRLLQGQELVVSARWLEHRPDEPRPVGFELPIQLEPNAGQIVLSLFTCMFLHGGILHLLSNMWFLWIFGDNVEDRLGHVIYLLFYLAGGLVASLFHWWSDPQSIVPVIGASGAVAAVLGAYFVTWPFAKVRAVVFLLVFITIVQLPALVVLGLWFLTQVIEATSVEGGRAGVAWWAHVGGFVAGMLLMLMLKKSLPPDEPPQPGTFDAVLRRPPRPGEETRWY